MGWPDELRPGPPPQVAQDLGQRSFKVWSLHMPLALSSAHVMAGPPLFAVSVLAESSSFSHRHCHCSLMLSRRSLAGWVSQRLPRPGCKTQACKMAHCQRCTHLSSPGRPSAGNKQPVSRRWAAWETEEADSSPYLRTRQTAGARPSRRWRHMPGPSCSAPLS